MELQAVPIVMTLRKHLQMLQKYLLAIQLQEISEMRQL